MVGVQAETHSDDKGILEEGAAPQWVVREWYYLLGIPVLGFPKLLLVYGSNSVIVTLSL